MRLRSSLPIVLAGTAVVVLVAASPAAAATSTTWVSPTDSIWSAATWNTTVPAADDDVTFAGGVRSTYDLGDVVFSSFHFTNEHTVANGGAGGIGLTAGLAVDPAAAVRIEPLVSTTGHQQWTVGSGATLTMPSQINVDPASTLTLKVDGAMAVTGNLDGGAAACIVKTGSGILSFESGGGGVGACAGQPAGLNVAAGEVAIVGTPNLGGKDFAVTGGTFTGGTAAGAAVVRALNLAGSGVVSPGPSSGAGIGMLSLWGTSAWAGGTYQVDWDAAANEADYVFGTGQAVTVDGTKLDIRLAGTPTAGQSVKILGSDISYSGRFASPAGTPLAGGDEFTSNGHVYSVEYVADRGASGVVLHWLRTAPVVVPPSTTPAATLPATGPEPALPLVVAALLLGVGALVIVAGRRLRRAGR